jgi:two-component system, OmpR family, sensor kinase
VAVVRTRPASLRRRVTLTGVVIVTVLVLALDVFVYFSLQDRMLTNLDRVLDAREQLARGLAAERTPEGLALQLDELGVRAVVRTADGEEFRSAEAPAYEDIPEVIPTGPDPLSEPVVPGGEPLSGRRVPLPDGGEVVVLASRAGIESTLDRLLLLAAVGTVVVVLLAYVALSRTSARVLRPVREVSSTARSIAEGSVDRRLAVPASDDELADMVAAFNGMLDALEDALSRSRVSEEASRRFLADAAHQLRTPAAGIRASVGTLLRVEEPEERDRLLDNLARETARMSKLLSALLRVARLDSGEETSRGPVAVDEVVDELAASQQALVPSMEVTTAHGSGAAVVDGDPVALGEAIANLLDNAARHARTQVRVAVVPHDRHVEVAVHDDGPGVAAADRERIFDRFVTADGSEGSGLGLPIARGVAEAHDGSLTYEDRAFRLRLPLRGS